jgi:S1-C subfamily serine protease
MAGLKAGDEVLRVDGIDAPNLTVFRLYSLLRQPRNRVALTIQRDGKALPALVTLPDFQFGGSGDQVK